MKREKSDKTKSISQKRDQSIDILRGSAVLLMIITHVNAIFLGEESFFLDRLTFLGATVCFSTFLFCFSFIYGLKLKNSDISKESSKKRLVKLLTVYFGLAIFIVTISNSAVPSLERIFDILTLNSLPIFIEFLIAFVFFDIFIYLFQKPLKKALRYPGTLFVISVLIYFLSRYLNTLDWGNGYINVIKSILVGHGEIHSFGLFSYMPIFLLGLIYGNFYEQKLKGKILALITGLGSLMLLLITEGFFDFRWERWPPSVLFHLYGVTYLFTIYFLTTYLEKVKYLKDFLVYMSRYTLHFYIFHVVLIFTITLAIPIGSLGQIATLIMNLTIFLLCSLLVEIDLWRQKRSNLGV